MRKDQKAEVVEEIAAQIADCDAIYATDYRGLSVSQAAALRASLREVDATFRVVKNTLTLRAAEKAGAEQVKELIEGPTAFAFVRGDPAAVAKALDAFARQEQALALRGAVLDGELLDADAVRTIARLPGRDRMNAQLAGVVASPLTGLVRGLGALLSGLAVALGQIREKKEAESPAPVEAETVVEEAPADEAEAEGPQAEEPQAEEPQAEEPQAEETQAEEPQAEEPQAEEPQAEEPQAEEPQAEEPQAEEPQAEEPQAESPQDESTDSTQATEDQAGASEKEAE